MVKRNTPGVAILAVFAEAWRNKETFDSAVSFPASLPEQIGKFYSQLIFAMEFFLR
jgi:hypothetical protein